MRHYETGSRRDSRSGKGRYDLISPYATKRLAAVLEEGADHYGERNWELGQDQLDFYDSARRHLDKWLMGWTDEDHLGRAYWNIHCMLHFDELGTQTTKNPPDYWIVDTKGVCDKLQASVSRSKPLDPPVKVSVPIPAKDALEAHTEPLRTDTPDSKCGYCHGGLEDCPNCTSDCGSCSKLDCVNCNPGMFDGGFAEKNLDRSVPATYKSWIPDDNLIKAHKKRQDSEMDRRELYRQMKRGDITQNDYQDMIRQMP